MHIFFIEGFFAGLLVSMPMGAIGMLCLRYILTEGKEAGFAAGLGIAIADAVAAFIGLLGLAAITSFLHYHEIWTHLIGSIILISFGIALIYSEKKKSNKKTEKGLAHITLIMFIITLTNPLTLISFTGIFASLGLDSSESSFLIPTVLSIGVFFGSLSWWVILIFSSLFFKIDQKTAKLINEISGFLLIAMGIFSLGVLGLGFYR